MTAPSFVELDEHEVVIADDQDPSEWLFRQICAHIWDIQYDRPNLHSFGPQESDHRKPSFSRASAVTAQESRDWHNKNARSKSKGVWACSIEEVHEASTRAIDDSGAPPDDEQPQAPGHAYVDYRHMGKGTMKAVKAKLLMAALDRGEIPTVDNSDSSTEVASQQN